ncbi:MAG: hypothetical protein ACE5KH_00780 [Candidatus Geothermarchaeales archaeon]
MPHDRLRIVMGPATAILERFFHELEKKKAKKWSLSSDGFYLRLKRKALSSIRRHERLSATKPPAVDDHMVFHTSDGSITLSFHTPDQEVRTILEQAEERANKARRKHRSH